jgi:hypothetical protein
MRWYSSVTRNLVASATRDDLSQVAGVPQLIPSLGPG